MKKRAGNSHTVVALNKSRNLFKRDSIKSYERENGNGLERGGQITTAQEILKVALRRVHSWRTPPNWTAKEWFKEISQVAHLALAQESCASATRRCHADQLQRRIIAAALKHYRKEWRYALRFVSEKKDELTANTNGRRSRETKLLTDDKWRLEAEMREAIRHLPTRGRWIINELFWKERTEAELGQALGISQPALNARKQATLERLRSYL